MAIQDQKIERMASQFRDCHNFERLEELAVFHGDIEGSPTIGSHLCRLGDDHVLADPDVEGAVCNVHEKLGVTKIGNLRFRFLERILLPQYVGKIMERHKQLLPNKFSV